MEVTYLTALDYEKVERLLEEKGFTNFDEICQTLKQLEKERRSQKVAAAALLSRNEGNVETILRERGNKSYQQNNNVIARILGMRHLSISDHDFATFSLKNIPITVEQTIIALRYAGFTVKSRREVDVTKDGFYVPTFHDDEGNIHPKNRKIQKEFSDHVHFLFDMYQELVKNGIPKEDARFLLPYSFNANEFMTIDAESWLGLMIMCLKTHRFRVPELKEFGQALYDIAQVEAPYLIEILDKISLRECDKVAELIESFSQKKNYENVEKPTLLNATSNIDEEILASAYMKRYQYTKEDALEELRKCDWECFQQSIADKLKEIEQLIPKTMKEYDCSEEMAKNVLLYPEWESYQKSENCFRKQLMRKIFFEGDREELHQVNFQFQVCLSLAVLTHLTRHRAHQLLIPEFSPTLDLTQYKVPTTIARGFLREYDEAIEKNIELYGKFKKEYGILDEELTGFALSGNTVNVVTNMDAWTLAHIAELRECNKAQWETRNMAVGMHREVTKNAKDLGAEIFTTLIGAPCKTQGICNEGKESCGLIKKIEAGKEKQYFLR